MCSKETAHCQALISPLAVKTILTGFSKEEVAKWKEGQHFSQCTIHHHSPERTSKKCKRRSAFTWIQTSLLKKFSNLKSYVDIEH